MAKHGRFLAPVGASQQLAIAHPYQRQISAIAHPPSIPQRQGGMLFGGWAIAWIKDFLGMYHFDSLNTRKISGV